MCVSLIHILHICLKRCVFVESDPERLHWRVSFFATFWPLERGHFRPTKDSFLRILVSNFGSN